MSNAKPTLSIVIIAFNEEDFIGKCLQSCIDQTDPADEIIVIDNNSRDRTAEIVKRLALRFPAANIRLKPEREQGMVPARNAGFNAATSEIIGRIDADSVLTRNWCAVARRTFAADPTLAAITGPVIYHDMPLQQTFQHVDDAMRRLTWRVSGPFLFGSNVAIRKSAWQQVKHQTARDEADELHEDIDLSFCLEEAGLEKRYVPDLVGGMSARRADDSPREFARYTSRWGKTFKRHHRRGGRQWLQVALIWSWYPVGKIWRKIMGQNTKKSARRR